MKLLLLVAILATILFATAPSPADAGVHSRISPLMRVPTWCAADLQIAGLNVDGKFIRISRTRAKVFLRTYTVCRPLHRFWHYGWPSTRIGKIRLGQAIFVVSHEEQHVELWERRRTQSEQYADCQGAAEFKPWARRIGVTSAYHQARLQYLIRHPLVVGYPTTNWTGCWH